MGTLLVLLSFGSSELTSGFWFGISLLLLSLDDSEGEESMPMDEYDKEGAETGRVISKW